MKRRSFVKRTATGAAFAAAAGSVPGLGGYAASERETPGPGSAGGHRFNLSYSGENLNRIAFPLGGFGAGMICLEGTGALSHFSLHNRPDIFNEPLTFSALCIRGAKNTARVLEGQVPPWKVFGSPRTGNGAAGTSFGLPRFDRAEFSARFPFATVRLSDDDVPLAVEITGWSPFVPGDADNSSLPAAILEFTFRNASGAAVEAVYSFNAVNFMASGADSEDDGERRDNSVARTQRGFVLRQPAADRKPWRGGAFLAAVDDPQARVNCRWFRGGWWDPLTIAWKNVEEGAAPDNQPVAEGQPSPGGSLSVPFTVGPGAEKKITLTLCWYVPESSLRDGPELKYPDDQQGGVAEGNYRPWYAGRFASVEEVAAWLAENCAQLRQKSLKVCDSFYDTDLPAEIVEAAAANLTILKSPTVLRQTDGRLWCWEGCSDDSGCCRGSCTHVWNYAQAVCHLFPELERSLRRTEFFVDQDERGHQTFRASLPIRCTTHEFHAASDGQLGGIMKAFREWRISGDKAWLAEFWPRIRQSLDYCIATWDPRQRGVLEEPHHNTYDIEFWGPDGMCSSFYLGALKAAALMGKALGDDVSRYRSLYEKGRKFLEEELFNGEYFVQKITTEGLDADPLAGLDKWNIDYSPEAVELLKKEGPKYQYGQGCLSDGVLGAWIAEMCGVGEILDPAKVASHLRSVYRYNFKPDLSAHANPQRPSYAVGREAGLLLCTWPRGGELTLPFVYSDEVWTGIEYQVASHLLLVGEIEAGCAIVAAARSRYDGRVRNPFNEYECGHWYARALASYGLIQGLAGIRYDAVEKVLHVMPSIRGDFRSFLSTATGYGSAGVKDGKPFLEVREGKIEVKKTEYSAAG